jgi:hypothetical protein
MKSVMGATIDQETCYGGKNDKKCWNPRTVLDITSGTKHEYGFGLGQTTIVKKNGTATMDVWSDQRNEHGEELAGWTWENRFDPKYQIRSFIFMQKACETKMIRLVQDEYNRRAMCDAAYNGGLGSVLSDRRLCASRSGCDPQIWFGHVEINSSKSKTPWKNYGNRSPYEINRGHVTSTMIKRRPPYQKWFGEAF